MKTIDYGPATHMRVTGHQNPEFNYPERFKGRVPKTIRIVKGAASDRFAPKDLRVEKKDTYPAWTNQHGAVSAITPDGKLGLYPDEYEVLEWLDASEIL